jgi:murein DD-endopeptidase MepM/ murein hydrolase activator NlpD
VAVNESKDLAIRIYNPNDGTSNRVLTGTVQVSGNGFSLQSPSTFELLPGEGRIFTIRFRPTASGNYSGTLTINHNASNYSSPLNIALKGSAGNVTTIRLSVSPSSLDFGQVEINTTQELSVTITNDSTSTGTLTISDLQVSGSGFKLAGGQSTNFSLSPGQSKTVRVQFNPTAKTTYSGSLLIYHNATNLGSPHEVSLKGTGVEFSYRLSINVSPANSGTILVNGQEVNLLPFERSYAKGTNLTLEAKEKNNYSFKNWSGSLSSTNKTISLTLNSDINLTANFVSASSGKQVLNVQVNNSALGQVRIVGQTDWGTSFSKEFNTNETVTIEAGVKPGVSGVSFTGWAEAPTNISGNPITLKMDRSYSIIAEFKDTQKPVIGELSVTPSSVLLYGEVKIRATATDNIGVQEVIATIVKPNNSREQLSLTREDSGAYLGGYNKTNIPGKYTVTVQVKDAQGNSSEKTISFDVKYESNVVKLTVKAGQGGKVQINNEEPKEQIIMEFTKGSKRNIKIKALPLDGYTFGSWQVNPPNIIPDAYLSKQEVTVKIETIQTDVEIIAKFSEKMDDRGIYAPWRKGASLTPQTYIVIENGKVVSKHHKDLEIKNPDGSTTIIDGKNRAVDFPAKEGAIVLAPHGGELRVRRWEHSVNGEPNVSYYEVIIKKNNQFYTHYVHIVPIFPTDKAGEVNKGNNFVIINNEVKTGDPIGFVSDLGWAKSPHIHFQISKDGKYHGAVDLTKQKMEYQHILPQKESRYEIAGNKIIYKGDEITSDNPGVSESGKDYTSPLKESNVVKVTVNIVDNSTLNVVIQQVPSNILTKYGTAKIKIIVFKWFRLSKQIKDSVAYPLPSISESTSIKVEIPKARQGKKPDEIKPDEIKIFVLNDNQPIIIPVIITPSPRL